MKYKIRFQDSETIPITVEAVNEEEAISKTSNQSEKIERVLPLIDSIGYEFALSRILKPGKTGKWELWRDVLPAGQPVALYDRSGRIMIGECSFDYPLVALAEGDNIWMSDSPLEIGSALGAVEKAKGDCLVSGLGIGLMPTLIKDKAETIDIVEANKDVIDLVYPQISSPKTRIIQDDIFHYLDTTDTRYDFIHVDIWGTLTAPFIEIEKTHEKAKRCLKPGGVSWCWLQELYDRIKDKLPKSSVQPGNLGRYEPCLICGNQFREDWGGLCGVCAEEMGIKKIGKKT